MRISSRLKLGTSASAEEFCRVHGVLLADGHEQLLAAPNVDAVVLATLHSLHESQIIAAAGKHIHVEKRISLDRADLGMCDGLASVLCAPILYSLRSDSLIRANDAIYSMTLE
jgi:hypothetical protein